MESDFITIKSDEKRRESLKRDSKDEPKKNGISLRAKLIIILLAVLFVALNGAGYYLYRNGYFGAGADILTQKIPSSTPSPSDNNENKRDAIFMIPEAP